MKGKKRCWSNREQVWRQSTEYRCQRREGHSGFHSHIYSDGKLEWDKNGKEFLNRKELDEYGKEVKCRNSSHA